VSTAVTHVLAIGITTILISGLLVAAAGLLTGQQDSAGREELQEIGNRIAEQIYVASERVDQTESGIDSVTITVTQPARVAGYSYTATLVDGGECSGALEGPPGEDPDLCLELDPDPSLDVRTQRIPVDVEGDVGSYPPDAVSLERDGSGEFRITVEN
jgi:type II secretory pathway pseudopilin PulG